MVTKSFIAAYQGEVVCIEDIGFYTLVKLAYKNHGKSCTMDHRIYDSTATLFKKQVDIGDVVEGNCVIDLKDKYGKAYSKITSFNITSKFPKPIKVKSNCVKNEVLQGVITNTNNLRDKVSKHELSFCLKTNKNKVHYISANKSIVDSAFFKKGSLVKVEVLEEYREIKFPNKTYKLITLWQAE